MAAPIYSQIEADAVLALPKRIEHAAWEKRKTGRPTDYETSVTVAAIPEINGDGIEFCIEIRTNELTEDISVILTMRIGKRPLEGLCRYDIHDSDHDNPRWFTPATIAAGEFHSHLYSERSVQEFDRWDKCASPLDLSPHGSPAQLRQRLWGRFLDDMRIKFSDSETFDGLFGSAGKTP
jgi:hypothetical protein